MSESLRKKLVFLTLPLALLYAAYSLQTKKATESPTSDASLATIQPVDVASAGLSVGDESGIDREKLLAAPWGRDPFRFGSQSHMQQVVEVPTKIVKSTTAATVDWKVSGILYSESNPIAYVNRKAVTVGETVDNAKVVAITKTSVTLEYAGKRFTVVPR